eukprot:6546083-Prymnesium_polylepis.1
MHACIAACGARTRTGVLYTSATAAAPSGVVRESDTPRLGSCLRHEDDPWWWACLPLGACAAGRPVWWRGA